MEKETAASKKTAPRKRAPKDATVIPMEDAAFLMWQALLFSDPIMNVLNEKMRQMEQSGREAEGIWEDEEFAKDFFSKVIWYQYRGALFVSMYPLLKVLMAERPSEDRVVKLMYQASRIDAVVSGELEKPEPTKSENSMLMQDQAIPTARWLDPEFRELYEKKEAEGDDIANEFDRKLRKESVAYFKKNSRKNGVFDRCREIYLRLIKDFPKQEGIENETQTHK